MSLYAASGASVALYTTSGTMPFGAAAPPRKGPKPAGYVLNTAMLTPATDPATTVVAVGQDLGGTFTRWDNAALTPIGLVPEVAGSATVKNKVADYYGRNAYGMEFIHTGRTIDVEGAGIAVTVRVGATVNPAWPVTPGVGQSVRIDFGSHGTRTVIIEIAAKETGTFSGLRITDGGSIASVNTTRRKLYILGDSWVQGAAFSKNHPGGDGVNSVNAPTQRSMAWLSGIYAGADIYYGGIGGTAYRNGLGVNDYADPNRLALIEAVQPDEVLVFGSINSGGPDTAGATAFYDGVKARVPGARIIVAGRESYSDATNAVGIDADIKSAADAATNVLGYVSPRLQAWITGTGSTTAPAGNGNADLYHNGENPAHLSDAGNQYYGQKNAVVITTLAPA